MQRQPAAKNAVPSRRLSREKRLEQLVDVAEQLFMERGYSAVSVEDIARAAGVSRPVVYEHFGTREGSYLACVRRARAEYQQRLLSSIDLTAPPREQLTAGVNAFYEMLEEDPGRWLLLFGSGAVLGGEFGEELSRLRFETIAQIHALIRLSLPNADEDRLEAFANAISGIGERLGHWWLTRPDLSRQAVVEHHVEIVWHGGAPYLPKK